ncbi:MAG: hypothetical protein LQ339_008704 [Xanthoria mediterranea]|nr:MAG: hypothetical protein LQ339_008704 [Xanthoria mediterranea]
MAVVVALVAVSCVAWVTDYLRQWTSEHSGEETPHPLFQNRGVIRSNGSSQLCLSALWNTANILILFFHSRLLPSSANIACDGILLLSLLASGIWITLAATTSIDGTTALDIRFDAPFDDFSGPSRRKDAVELIGICTTFVTALLHIPLTISAILTTHHSTQPHQPYHHPITRKDISHLSIHPALRPTPSPLPYPNPNHPTCAYAAKVHYPPPRAVRYQHQASPSGVHARADASPPRHERLDGGRASGVLEDKGGLLMEGKKKEGIREQEKAIDF